MTHEINFLKPLKGNATKSFIYNPEKFEWKLQEGYKAGKFFDGYTFPVENIRDAYDIIRKHQESPVFMIQGGFLPGIHLRNIVRRVRSDRDDHAPTLTDRSLNLVCFDVDGYPCEDFGPPAIEIFIQELPAPFWESDYIYQFSASHGLFDDGLLKCHLFFWLSEPVLNTDIREWVIEYNKEKKWKNILDPAVFVATQPIYTQRRICIGAPDPIQDFLGLVEKSGDLDWNPAPAKESIPASRRKAPEKKSDDYSLSEGVKKILTGANFHDEINKLALSLMGKGLAAAEIIETIKGLMLAAKENISAPKRLQDWQTRFNDIARSVNSAFDLVDNPNQTDLLAWLKSAPAERILKEFPAKTFKKAPGELKEIVDAVAKRTGIDKRELKRRVKGFKEIAERAGKEKGRADLMRDRAKRNIFEVVINDHNAIEATEQIAGILRKSRRWPPVFVYGSGLAYVEFDKLITIRQMSKQHAAKKRGEKYCRTPVIRSFKKPFHDLIARLGMDARFVRQKLGKEIQCPEKLASVVAMGNSRENRELTGIVNCPFVQADWRLFQKNGYDPATGLYSIIENKIPDERWDTFEAYNFLKDEVLAEFPFDQELDAAVMIASMMALMQRPLLAQDSAGMPGFGVIAPVQSSGKTALVDLVTSAVLKSTIPASNFSNDEEEMSKHILALLREGHPCVLFDNIPHDSEIKADVLAKAMSSDIYSGRLLGETKTLTVPSSAIWFFTGNNIQFSGDFSTRVFPVRLNPRMENPETRKYKRENGGLDWTLHNRSRILNALISIIQDGQNYEPLDTGSRFKIWDRYIRLPLHKASGVDINAAIISNKEHDKDFMNKKKLMENLYEEFGSAPFVSRKVIDAGFPSGPANPPTPLGERLEEILGKYFESPKSVGKLLGKMVGRAYGDMILGRVDTDRAWWQIEKIADE
jgi:hypothetical protein